MDHSQVRYLLYQANWGGRYMHSSSVMDRDIKPADILNADCTLKICDFGQTEVTGNLIII